MASYAIGDLQGCADEFARLLDKLNFDPACDHLWLAGDLVNRGPGSLAVLRRVRELGDRAVCVLGNHDIHLLAMAYGTGRKPRPSDTLRPVLDAPDCGELVDWLRRRPLFHHDDELGWAMLHAGLPPQWDIATAAERAREVEKQLTADDPLPFLTHLFGSEPTLWDDGLEGWDRLRYIINAFTRLRYVTESGELALKPSGAPGTQPRGCLPWFDHPERASRGQAIVFGHWSTLGLHRTKDTFCLDSGCLWGGELTALRLDGPRGRKAELTRIPCPEIRTPS